MPLLRNGDVFPRLTIRKVGGGTIDLPADLKGSFGVVLVYRGAWCPYCNAQLAGFERASGKLGELGVKVVAFSVDDEAKAAEIVAKHKIGFPVGFGADAKAVAATIGCYVNEDPLYLQTTGFVLAPDGAVVNAVYSSSAIGRLVADDVAGLVSYIKSKM
ncbi:MAG: redoxin domain-containing protein [Roseiarcus sp.]|jgi:peroxiredoxin